MVGVEEKGEGRRERDKDGGKGRRGLGGWDEAKGVSSSNT